MSLVVWLRAPLGLPTIVMVWMLAFGIVSVSAQIGVQSHHVADSAASIEK